MNHPHNVAAVILAAGLGTRMKSGRAKVLHEISDIPMIYYVLETASKISGEDVVVVVGNQAETVQEVVSRRYNVHFALQEEQLGTGHAVQCAMDAIPEGVDDVLILCGDVPLVRPGTLQGLIEDHVAFHRDVTILSVEMDDPSGYGRVVYDDKGDVCAIVEHADATEAQKKIRTINTGIYCVNHLFLVEALQLLKADNQQGELYLTDILHIGHEQGRKVGTVVSTDFEEFIGINTPEDLQKVASILFNRGKSS